VRVDYVPSPVLPNFLRTIPHLNCLTIDASRLHWDALDSSMKSAFLHLMHLPTMNHINLSYIKNFPLSSLTPSVNLHRLDMSYLSFDRSPEIVVQSEMMPKIREFHYKGSGYSEDTTKLLHAKMHDGRPFFNFMDLRRLSTWLDDERNIRYLLQNVKLLENLHITVCYNQSLVGLHDNLSPSARTLKVLELIVPLRFNSRALILAGLCEELEMMEGHYTVLDALSLEVRVGHDADTEDSIGSIIQKVEKVLVSPGWSALRQVSLKLSTRSRRWEKWAELSKALQSLPDKYLSHLPKLESVAFNYSVYA